MKNWSLFLDRDGVINERLPGEYVHHWSAFQFCPGALEALRLFSHYFARIVVVTNQQGVGKGLMSEAELALLHQQMLHEVEQAGGRIDKIYACTEKSSPENHCRKPSPKMALDARHDFPDINFSRSIMVGDSFSDLVFGQNLGMYVVWIMGKEEDEAKIADSPTLLFQEKHHTLWQFAQSLMEKSDSDL
jgi:D-glycero-D-manno-heptose 1,7-bisphosphate phosphatase